MSQQQRLIGTLALLLFVAPLQAASVSDFIDTSVTGLPSRLYVPTDNGTPETDRPLILFLPGLGEGGTDNLKQINGNINRLLAEAKERHAYLLAPQSYNGYWHNPTHTANIMKTIDQIIADYQVDPDRLYITGLSAGGAGVWNTIARHPDRFAAAAVMAGGKPADGTDISAFKDVPIRAYHAANDTTVSPWNARNVINQLLVAKGEQPLNFGQLLQTGETIVYANDDLNLYYTEWTTGGHGIWGRAYNEEGLYDWMFSQSLQTPEPTSLVLLITAGGLMMRRGSHD